VRIYFSNAGLAIFTVGAGVEVCGSGDFYRRAPAVQLLVIIPIEESRYNLRRTYAGFCELRFVLFRYMKAVDFCGAFGLGKRSGWGFG